MRAKLIAATIVLLLMLSVCVFANLTIKTDTERMHSMSNQAIVAFKRGDAERALQLLSALQATLDERRPLLEVLTTHEAINEVSLYLAEARAWLLSNEPREQFVGSMAMVNESLTVLYELQRLSWSNLF